MKQVYIKVYFNSTKYRATCKICNCNSFILKEIQYRYDMFSMRCKKCCSIAGPPILKINGKYTTTLLSISIKEFVEIEI